MAVYTFTIVDCIKKEIVISTESITQNQTSWKQIPEKNIESGMLSDDKLKTTI